MSTLFITAFNCGSMYAILVMLITRGDFKPSVIIFAVFVSVVSASLFWLEKDKYEKRHGKA